MLRPVLVILQCLCVCVCVCVCVCECVHVPCVCDTLRDQTKALGPMNVDLHMTATWVL